ncbi:MAG: S53 family peptidase, partial [Actinomycetota bacterium]|nr:S53 family peptidase [Actinomycetota bacterium]
MSAARALVVVCAAAGLVLSVVAGSAPALAATTPATAGPHAPASRAVGSAAMIPFGAHAIGAVAPATQMNVDVLLRPRDPAALAAFVHAVTTPGSPEYRHYLAQGQFGPRFGPTPASIAAVRRWLVAQGLHAGPTTVDGLSIPVTTTASRLSHAFGTPLVRYRLASGRIAFANTRAPQAPAAFAGVLQGVNGLANTSLPHPIGLNASLRSRTSLRARVDTTGAHVAAPSAGSANPAPKPAAGTGSAGAGKLSSTAPRAGATAPCAAASSTAASGGSYTADQIAGTYNMTSIENGGRVGTGVAVALYELETYTSSDIAAYQSCYGTNVTIHNVSVDGGACYDSTQGQNPGSNGCMNDQIEATLDFDQIIGLAPGVTIYDYNAPNGGTGPLDTIHAIVDGNNGADPIPQVVSTSWGECEPDLGGLTAAQQEDTYFQEAAAEGQGWFAAAGDQGSEDCLTDGSGNPSYDSLEVDDPGSQPYVTSVGGTYLFAAGSPPTEGVWNDGGGSCSPSNCTYHAGGGGISTYWPMPTWQQTLGINANSSGAPCGQSTGSYCREVPDVSADASPYSGYVIDVGGTWQAGWAGTSAAAPLWASVAALVDQGCTPSQGNALAGVGFINPALYQAAASNPSVVNDVTTANDGGATNSGNPDPGNNDLTGDNSGQYPATTGYDMATGLGSPNAAALETAIGCTATSPSIGSFSAASSSLGSAGGSDTLSWTVSNAST